MKVLMLIPSYFPTSSGGAEHAVKNIARGLQDLGVYVEILTLNVSKRWKGIPKTKQTEMGGLLVTYWGCFFTLFNFKQDITKSCSHTFWSQRYTSAWLGPIL